MRSEEAEQMKVVYRLKQSRLIRHKVALRQVRKDPGWTAFEKRVSIKSQIPQTLLCR